MVKLIFLCRRRPDITHERYSELLLSGHVAIALKHHPMMRHYLVNIVEQSPAGWDARDSIGELSFDSLDDFHDRLYDSPAGRQIGERDVAGFMGEQPTNAARADRIFLRNFFAFCKRVVGIMRLRHTGWGRRPRVT